METVVVDAYNDIAAQAEDHDLRTTRPVDLGLSYRDLLAAIDIELGYLECPEPKLQLVEEGLFDAY